MLRYDVTATFTVERCGRFYITGYISAYQAMLRAKSSRKRGRIWLTADGHPPWPSPSGHAACGNDTKRSDVASATKTKRGASVGCSS